MDFEHVKKKVLIKCFGACKQISYHITLLSVVVKCLLGVSNRNDYNWADERLSMEPRLMFQGVFCCGEKQGISFPLQRSNFFPHSALLLNSVMRAFRPEFVAARATDFIGMIKDCDEAGFPKVRGHRQL